VVFDKTQISEQCATELLRRFTGNDLTVTGIRRLHGGMVNSVLELTTDGEPRRVVAKLSSKPGHRGFEHEHSVLDWVRTHTRFPVPEPYGCDVSGEVFGGSCLMMERLPGENLGHAQLTSSERQEVERQMARHVAALHEFRRGTYGSALRTEADGLDRWIDDFGPRIRREFEEVAGRLTSGARTSIGAMLESIDEWLPEAGEPTLVHGDLWATNIIVDPLASGAPQVTGFVDGGCNYADVEYELAYLLVFRTVGNAFFEEYEHHHELRPGFEVRCRVYWINTMLLHVRVFGDEHYVQACEGLARELERLAPEG
jgi:fructosamine-3-kinase